jgi:hypothetical protein
VVGVGAAGRRLDKEDAVSDLLKNPAVRRLVGRALTAGVLAGIAAWQASDGTAGALSGVVVAAAMAAIQVFTPLASVGPVKAKK